MTITAPAPVPTTRTVRVRLASGQVIDEPLGVKRQVRLFGYVLHHNQLGLTEFIRGKRDQNTNDLQFQFRGSRGSGKGDLWFPADDQELLVDSVIENRDDYELFLTPACYNEPKAGNESVSHSAVAWIDQDDPDKVGMIGRFEHPPHMVVTSGGSGGVHAYWRLAVPVPRDPLRVINRKLVNRLEADRQSHNPGRFLRIPGSYNMKSEAKMAESADGRCRIIWADLHRPPYDVETLVEGLVDYKEPDRPKKQRFQRIRKSAGSPGWIEQVVDIAAGTPPPEYYYRLTGLAVNQSGGLVSCPHPNHEDRNPSCHVFGEAGKGFYCFSCGATGNAFEMAAYLAGWNGGLLRGSTFVDAARNVAQALGIEIDKEQTK